MKWRLTIPRDIAVTGVGPWVVTGTGPVPVAELLDPPVVPPVDPPPPPPPVDNRPFNWPPEWLVPGEATARYRQAWLIPGRREDDPHGRVFVYLSDAGNAIGASHHNAGIIAAGRWAGYRLWAPHDAPPAMLRAILATSAP